MDFLHHLRVTPPEHPIGSPPASTCPTGNYIVNCLAFLATANAVPPPSRSQSPSSQHDCIPRAWWRRATPVSAAFIAWQGQLLLLLEADMRRARRTQDRPRGWVNCLCMSTSVSSSPRYDANGLFQNGSASTM